MEIAEVLEKIGLNEKEAKVYLALLELGTASAYGIAPKANLKRPITYIVLESLMQKGLVTRVPQVRKALYVAEDPNKLLGEVRHKEELLKRFMPSLEVLYNARKEKPRVQLFEGIAGIRSVYEKVLASGEEVLFFGTGEGVQKHDPEWVQLFLKRIQEQHVPVKDIIMQNPRNVGYIQLFKNTSYLLRYMPKGFTVPADSVIFGDNVGLFSFRPTIFCVLITSKDLSSLMRTWHAMAWESALPIGWGEIKTA